VEQLLSLVFGERCGSGCGLFIRYFPYIFLLELRKITTYLSERPIPWQNLIKGYLVKPTPWRRVLEKIKSFSASPKISCISQNPKIHYCVRKSPPIVQILSQINSVHALNPITLTSILFHTHVSLPSGLLPSAVPTKPLYAILVPPIYATACTIHLNLLHFSL